MVKGWCRDRLIARCGSGTPRLARKSARSREAPTGSDLSLGRQAVDGWPRGRVTSRCGCGTRRRARSDSGSTGTMIASGRSLGRRMAGGLRPAQMTTASGSGTWRTWRRRFGRLPTVMQWLRMWPGKRRRWGGGRCTRWRRCGCRICQRLRGNVRACCGGLEAKVTMETIPVLLYWRTGADWRAARRTESCGSGTWRPERLSGREICQRELASTEWRAQPMGGRSPRRMEKRLGSGTRGRARSGAGSKGTQPKSGRCLGQPTVGGWLRRLKTTQFGSGLRTRARRIGGSRGTRVGLRRCRGHRMAAGWPRRLLTAQFGFGTRGPDGSCDALTGTPDTSLRCRGHQMVGG
jgi:hypothetical protein